jgi:hypothetical protein
LPVIFVLDLQIISVIYATMLPGRPSGIVIGGAAPASADGRLISVHPFASLNTKLPQGDLIPNGEARHRACSKNQNLREAVPLQRAS